MADYSLALGVRPPQIEDPLTAYSKFAAIQNAQTQNALVQQQLATARRAEAKDIERTNALASAGTDDTAIANALIRSGDLQGYSQFVKSRRETLKADTELVTETLKQSRLFLDAIDPDSPDAPQQFKAWTEANHRNPVLSPVFAARGVTPEQSRASIEQAVSQGPQAVARLINMARLGTEEFIKQNKPQVYTQGTGNETRLISVPGLGGAAAVVPGSVASMQLTPNDRAQQNRPVSVAPGATLVNPITGAEIFRGPAAPAQEPPEVRLLQSLGLPVTLEGIAQLRQAQTGTPQEPPEVRLLNALGLPVTLESIAQVKQAQTGTSQEPNEIKMLKALGLPVTPEGLNLLKQAQTVVLQDPKDPIIRQYEYAKAQGFVGSLFDFKRKLSEAGRPISTSGGGAAAPLERVFDTKTGSQELVDRSEIRANPGRYKPLGAEEKLRNIPETINKGLTGNVASISQIDRAIDAVTKNPNAVGLRGNFPQTILNRADPAGVEARALVTDVGSAKVHDRSGAAVAASEAPRLMPFIPQATDDAATVVKKLRQLKTQIEIEQSGILDFYSQEQGYKPSLYHRQQITSVAPAATPATRPSAANPAARNSGGVDLSNPLLK
jgi:hypothetical protein